MRVYTNHALVLIIVLHQWNMQKHYVNRSLILDSITTLTCKMFWIAYCMLSIISVLQIFYLAGPTIAVHGLLLLQTRHELELSVRSWTSAYLLKYSWWMQQRWKIREVKYRLPSRSQSLFWDSAAEILELAVVGQFTEAPGVLAFTGSFITFWLS